MILWNPNPMLISKKKWDSYTDEEKMEIRRKHTENLALLSKQKREMNETKYYPWLGMSKKELNYAQYKKKQKF